MISLGLLALILGFGIFIGAILLGTDLQSTSSLNITINQISQAEAQAPMLQSMTVFFIFGGIVVIGAGMFLQWQANKEPGMVLGVCDVEIAIKEREIQKMIKKNQKRRVKAHQQIDTINEIEKAALEKKLIEPGQEVSYGP